MLPIHHEWNLDCWRLRHLLEWMAVLTKPHHHCHQAHQLLQLLPTTARLSLQNCAVSWALSFALPQLGLSLHRTPLNPPGICCECSGACAL